MRRTVLVACVLSSLAGCGEKPVGRAENDVTGLRYLGGDSGGGFERAVRPRPFVFPEDHGPHPSFRTEWWYFTGNVTTSEGRHFGFELTFFRYALGPEAGRSPEQSAWRTNQTWMAHLAITDTAAGRFSAAERLARQSLGVAGAGHEPLGIWIKDWSARGTGENGLGLTLVAEDEDIGLRLEVRSAQTPVAHGENGLDRKGPSIGNASYYYSVPRLATQGTLRVGADVFEVAGLTWLDREWSTSALERDVVGWDWFALQMADGASLMFYRLRSREGGASPFSSGSWVAADGRRQSLGAADVEVTPVREWRSGRTGVRYPVAWRLRVPGVGLSLDIEPAVDDQEIDLTVRYWEGAISARGASPAGRVSGRGYLELAGY